MMPGLPDDHPSIRFYDGDYPGAETSEIAENLDEMIAIQGLASDVDRYKALARDAGGDILELGCGTGRVLVPLAREGYNVTGIDISPAMIDRLGDRIAREEESVRQRIRCLIGDVRAFDLDRKFALIIFPFNGLSCLPDFNDQRKAIGRAADHLDEGGKLVIDLVNPLILPLKGDDVPKPFLNRRNPDSGHYYTRFAAMGRMKADQTQALTGWYDEIDDDGLVHRTPYRMTWRLVFRYEIQLMIEAAGLTLESIEGDHQGNLYCETSPKLFVIAGK